MDNESEKVELRRRDFLRDATRGAAVVGLTATAAALLPKGAKAEEEVWQINPHKCTECGKCETHCVLKPSAVKAVHAFGLCGFCDLCTAYFKPEPFELHEGAENHMCPTDAIERRYVEEPYYEYKIDEDHCVGCAKCVDGCRTYGNGSMHLQIQHDICVDCDSCSINNACPSDAFVKVPASNPYLFKGEENTWHQ
jgi:electron transport complex protein RnfB